MEGRFEVVKGKMAILKILTFFVIMTLGITGYLKGVEGAISGGFWTEESGFRTLSENEAEGVRRIWRVIGDQDIVKWDGKEWLGMSKERKEEVVSRTREAWRIAGYKKIKSIECFIEDIDRYYNDHIQKEPQEGTNAKVGLVLSLSAFFSGMEK